MPGWNSTVTWGAYNRVFHHRLQVWIELLAQLGLDMVLYLYIVCETVLFIYLRAFFMKRLNAFITSSFQISLAQLYQ